MAIRETIQLIAATTSPPPVVACRARSFRWHHHRTTVPQCCLSTPTPCTTLRPSDMAARDGAAVRK